MYYILYMYMYCITHVYCSPKCNHHLYSPPLLCPQSTVHFGPNSQPPPPPPGVLRQDEISETKNLGLRATGLRLGHHMVGGAGRGRVAS